MWAVYILLALLGIVLLALLIPLSLRIAFDGALHIRLWLLLPFRLDTSAEEEGMAVTVRVLGCPVWTYPADKEDKPADAQEVEKAKSRASGKVQELVAELKSGNPLSTLTFVRDFLRLISCESKRLFRRVTVGRLWLQARIATGDAAETAQLYGSVCGVLYPLLAQLERTVRVRNRQIRVEPDFVSEQGAVRFDLRLRVGLPAVISAVLAVVRGMDSLNETNQ